MNKLIIILILSEGFILTGCADPHQQNVRQPDYVYEDAFVHHPFGGA